MIERSSPRRGLARLNRTSEEPSASGIVATTGSDAVNTIAPGTVLDGKYHVLRVLGTGAVGVVFEAMNLELDEKVAIKCLRPEIIADTAMVARFAREAKAAAAIKSEYVATVYDVGTHGDGIPFIVMEYLEGKTLETLLGEKGSFETRSAIEYTLQVCEALAVAHSKGIVHRDIKPENLLLTERAGGMRIVKVLDFGISKTALTGSIFGDDLPLVKTLNLMGTPLYMSPEQVRSSADVDERSDIWALGLVLYEILSGQTAFTGASITEICAAILESPPRPLEAFRNDLPAGLLPVIDRCLAKNAADRYQTVADFALALMPFGPKRSRLNVERAVSVLQAAGKLDPSVEVQSTAPASSAEALRISSSAIPPMARLPSVSTLPPHSPQGVTTLPPAMVSASSGLLPLELEVTSTRTEIDVRSMRRRRSPAVALVVAAIVAIGIAAAVVSRTTSEPAQPSARATPAPETKPRSIAPEQPTTVATTVAERTSAPAALPSVLARPALPRHVPGVAARAPVAPPRPTTSQGAAVAQPVKAEKKASSNAGEEPDLGY